MRAALASYAGYRAGADRAALGRFIVPLSRLKELEESGRDLLLHEQGPDRGRLGVLGRGEVRAAAEEMLAFNRRHSSGTSDGHAVIDVVELKAGDPADIARQHSALPKSFASY